jgi:hypothetical protein
MDLIRFACKLICLLPIIHCLLRIILRGYCILRPTSVCTAIQRNVALLCCQHLQGLGATLVTTEGRAKEDVSAAQLPRPRLGLNCVGGSSSAAVAKALM